jgi:hypothetical protein
MLSSDSGESKREPASANLYPWASSLPSTALLILLPEPPRGDSFRWTKPGRWYYFNDHQVYAIDAHEIGKLYGWEVDRNETAYLALFEQI